MADDALGNAALVLVGHGSQQNAESCQSVLLHASELRRRRLFAEVREAFLQQEPRLRAVVKEVEAGQVFVVPFFMSEGYFTERIIPQELGLSSEGQEKLSRRRQVGSHFIQYCRPVGTHSQMTDMLLARAREVVKRHPFPSVPQSADLALVIVGHGTPKDSNSRQAIERQVERVFRMKLYAEVLAVFLEEEPRVADTLSLVKSRNVVVVPFFAGDGLHVLEDIPVLLGESERLVQIRMQQKQWVWRNPTERQGKRIWYSASVGSDPGLADVILDRVRESAGEG